MGVSEGPGNALTRLRTHAGLVSDSDGRTPTATCAVRILNYVYDTQNHEYPSGLLLSECTPLPHDAIDCLSYYRAERSP